MSRKAESTAVVSDRMSSIVQGCARPFLADQMARYSNMPQRRAIETSTIIPVSSAMVLKSIPAIASSWLRTPLTIIMPPPSRAMIERLSRSVMIRI